MSETCEITAEIKLA